MLFLAILTGFIKNYLGNSKRYKIPVFTNWNSNRLGQLCHHKDHCNSAPRLPYRYITLLLNSQNMPNMKGGGGDPTRCLDFANKFVSNQFELEIFRLPQLLGPKSTPWGGVPSGRLQMYTNSPKTSHTNYLIYSM